MKSLPLVKNLKEKYLRFFIYLFLVFLALLLLNTGISVWLSDNKLIPPPTKINTSLQYPVLKTSYLPAISAQGAIAMDSESKAILYSKNPKLRFSSASTTKIMTAVVALDHFKPNDILTAKTAFREGSILGIYPGEQFTFENLLYAMLLPSANDAASVIAENYPGGEEAFVQAMNNKATDFILNNTHYGDPAGLMDKENYTTPFDLARLASFALKYPEFAKIVATKYYTIHDISGLNSYPVENLNELLGERGVTGIKTGYTEEAGQVLVTSLKEGKDTIITVVMGSEYRFLDSRKLLDLVRGNLSYLSIHP